MNNKNQISITEVFIIAFGCILMSSCSMKNYEMPLDSTQILISDFEDVSCDFASMASKVDTMYLYQSDADMPVSAISCAYLTDSVLYVSDMTNALFSFDIQSGKNTGQMRKIGQSSDEYSEISALAVDKDTVFVLDRNMRKIVKYDSDFNHIETIRLSFVPIDFMVEEHGFVFSRFDVTDGKSRFVRTGRSGNEIDEDVSSCPLEQQLGTTRTFSSNGVETFLHEPNSSEIYSLGKGNTVLAYELVFPAYGKNSGKSKPLIKDFFVTSKSLVCSFMYDDKMFYCIYEKDRNISKAGTFDLNSGRPFFPIAQKGNSLVGVYHSADLTALKNWKTKNRQSVLTAFVYHF